MLIMQPSNSQAKALVSALISSTFDKDLKTKKALSHSIFVFGKTNPEVVLKLTHEFLIKHPKIDQNHHILILKCICNIIDETCTSISLDTACKLISLASEDLTKSKKVTEELQESASQILVSLGKCFLSQVMEEMLKKFVPGILPNVYVVKTIGELSVSNIHGISVFMEKLLSTTLPLLSLAKSDGVRIVFANVLTQFCESILEFNAADDSCKLNSVSKSLFATAIYGAYDVLHNNWLQTRNIKVVCAVLATLGIMCNLMEIDKLEMYIPKIISTIISLCKRHITDPLPLTSSLCNVLQAVCNSGSTILEHNLDGLIITLHSQICNTVEDHSESFTKNYNEVLRCFGILAQGYSEILIGTLLQKAYSRDEKVRAENLVILKHLINSNAESMDRHKDLIVTGFVEHCNENSTKVKLNFAKVIVAMATHGYLQHEGGLQYVLFIVSQCSLPDSNNIYQTEKSIPKSAVTNEQVRSLCDEILKVITTTVPDFEKLLWPYLFELVTNNSLSNSLGVICQSLAYLTEKKRLEKATDFIIDFKQQANIPSSVAIFSRLLVFLAYPLKPRCHPKDVILLLQNFSPNIHETLVETWDQNLPQLLAYLKDSKVNHENWSQTHWEDLLLKLLQKSVNVVGSEEWTCSVGEALTSQWRLYEGGPQYRNFSYKCLGVILRNTNNKEFIDSYLATLLLSILHAGQLDREGAAVCFGYCAATHLDATLSRLAEYVKVNITKKESSYFPFLKSEKSLVELENVKGLVALCCGYITFHASSDLITSRIETCILKTVIPLFKGIRNVTIKVDICNAVNLIAKSLDPSHLTSLSNKPRYVFAARDDLISKLLAYLNEDGNENATELKAAAITACASLVKLDPQMADEDISILIKQCLSVIIPMQTRKPTELNGDKQYIEHVSFNNKCTNSLYSLLSEILKKQNNSAGLYAVFRQLEPYLVKTKAHEREHALKTVNELFVMFYNLFKVSNLNSELSHLGILLARMIPCCCDEVPALRTLALNCIHQLLKIHNKYNGIQADDEGNQGRNEFDDFSILFQQNDVQLYKAVVDLAQVICKKIPSELLTFKPTSLTMSLLDGFVWPHIPSSYGACLTIHHIFRTRGVLFAQEIDDIVSLLLSIFAQLPQGKADYVKDGVLQLFSCLTSNHAQSCINALLTYPLPFTDAVMSCWRQIGSDPQLCLKAVEYLLEKYDCSLPYQEALTKKRKVKEGSTKTAMTPSLAICCALHNILQACNLSVDTCNEAIIHHTISMSIVRVGSMIDVKSPAKLTVDPYRQAVDLFHTIMKCNFTESLMNDLEGEQVWNLIEHRHMDSLQNALSIIARCICKHRPSIIKGLVSSLNTYLSSIYEMKRVSVVAFFVQLVKEPVGIDDVLLEIIISSLRSKLIDPSGIVRRLCIRGLANIIYTSHEQIERYSTSVLSAMMSGMDDKDDLDNIIALEAMSSLKKFLNKMERTNIHSIFVNICLRVRPCFENENPDVRFSAFSLFGALSKFGTGTSETSYVEQVHSNLVSILLHLNDDDQQVIKACKKTLREIASRVGSDDLKDFLLKHLVDETTLHYGEFMRNLSKVMVVSFPEKINFYVMGCIAFFKSQWPTLRGNAAIFTGFLMSTLGEEYRDSINKEHSCGALIQLLKDASPEVREKAAEAISLLVFY